MQVEYLRPECLGIEGKGLPGLTLQNSLQSSKTHPGQLSRVWLAHGALRIRGFRALALLQKNARLMCN